MYLPLLNVRVELAEGLAHSRIPIIVATIVVLVMNGFWKEERIWFYLCFQSKDPLEAFISVCEPWAWPRGDGPRLSHGRVCRIKNTDSRTKMPSFMP